MVSSTAEASCSHRDESIHSRTGEQPPRTEGPLSLRPTLAIDRAEWIIDRRMRTANVVACEVGKTFPMRFSFIDHSEHRDHGRQANRRRNLPHVTEPRRDLTRGGSVLKPFSTAKDRRESPRLSSSRLGLRRARSLCRSLSRATLCPYRLALRPPLLSLCFVPPCFFSFSSFLLATHTARRDHYDLLARLMSRHNLCGAGCRAASCVGAGRRAFGEPRAAWTMLTLWHFN